MTTPRTSNKAYHAIPALSHSLIWAIKNEGIYPAFLDSAFNPNRVEPEDKDALVQGQLYHIFLASPELAKDVYNGDAVLQEFPVCLKPEAKSPVYEPVKELSVDDFTVVFVFDFGLKRTNQKYIDIVAYLKQSGKWTDDAIVVNQAELDTAATMIYTLTQLPVYQGLMQHEVVSREESIEFEYKGMKFKSKPDILLRTAEGKYIIVDGKTTRLTTREGMQKEGERMGYNLQDVIHRHGVAAKYGVAVEDVSMVYLMQNKDTEYEGLICYAFTFEDASRTWAETDIDIIADDFMKRYANSAAGTQKGAFVDIDTNIYPFVHWEPKLVEQPA